MWMLFSREVEREGTGDKEGGEWAELERMTAVWATGPLMLIGGGACLMMSLGKVPVAMVGVACLVMSLAEVCASVAVVGVACADEELVGVACVMTSSEGAGWLPWEKGRSRGLSVISPTATRWCRLPSQIRPQPINLGMENFRRTRRRTKRTRRIWISEATPVLSKTHLSKAASVKTRTATMATLTLDETWEYTRT